MSKPQSFEPLGFDVEFCKKIKCIKPFIIRSTSIYIPLDSSSNIYEDKDEQITLIEFANMHNIPIDDINILLKNGISTVDSLSTVGISYLKTLGLSQLSIILDALSK